MAGELQTFLRRLRDEPAVLVTVRASRGSVPREAGTWMAVFENGTIDTIGGGHLEWDAMRRARVMLSRRAVDAPVQSVTLGPSLGQCCGGALELSYELVGAADAEALRERLGAARHAVALFGGGHVGRALVRALAPLPFAITWIDSRDEVFPDPLPDGVAAEHSDPVQGAVPALASGSLVLVMSFSHAEDLDIVAACLRRLRERDDLAFIGLIGSRTKWATFRHRLLERGFSEAELARVTCPIGLPGITGKAPAVIAAAVVAQLLLMTPNDAKSI
ncbi:MAG: xanthine dehydrogenase accessory protein XdhC [Hydrogenophaga sp.]|uniref:xanthine dehydrogenase accessory protein XdhC n=1 Tax=Hydrogenophaga sp. TaxID=1904254 RepID=UPI0016A033E5|nr:xanthine dehydrogenase accessory protein XdhC [Hydrogenophaga sp.]NIM42628.1 xanthine dehydrogenase accessory protein XdhC [Hydrogenophaga sp.]NIN25671.1 xanthine dehydrogenase accessory protein XdhC [Hydrogenophaga sp.]NIN30333.1 xanthine dehydrogenase accessory protein XdhC [Hydrogenophaga sp.]NIN56673.1 xanthine dehydrogenase accessory protein XdhC [Hydrogenophaga sp.]NIO53248.1 xanthine dehydrogenase accessory protein XdhC [Hydrogenophaga sp.]